MKLLLPNLSAVASYKLVHQVVFVVLIIVSLSSIALSLFAKFQSSAVLLSQPVMLPVLINEALLPEPPR